MTNAFVVGGGPNGLAAAVVLAAAGCSVTVLEAEPEIGGGTRTHEPLGPGLLVDHCSGFHPMAVDSPALAGLEAHGLRWAWPEIDCAHPLDDGSAALLHRSVTTTVLSSQPLQVSTSARSCTKPMYLSRLKCRRICGCSSLLKLLVRPHRGHVQPVLLRRR